MYADSGTGTGFSAYEWNFSTINLTTNYGQVGLNYFGTKFFCVNKGQSINNLPLATFESFNDFIDFFIQKFAGKSTLLNEEQLTLSGVSKIYVLNWPLEQPENVYNELTETDKNLLDEKIKKGSEVFIATPYTPPPAPTPTPTP